MMEVDELQAVIEQHGKWLSGNGGQRANLIGAYLRGANLQGANLRGANLYGANLYRANLHSVDLKEANLRGANLRRANLKEANLCNANLRGVDFRGAILYRADLSKVTMSWNSHTLIGERLRQAAGDSYERLALAGAVAQNPHRCWDWWLANTPYDIKEWALSVMKSWVKEGDNAPDFLVDETKESE